jgi:hypothetical protein
MAKRGTRKVVSYQGLKVRLKKGQTKLSTQQKNAIHRMEQTMSERGRRTRKGEGCVVVFFRSKAVQRCAGSSLSRTAKSRWKRQVRNRELCRKTKRGHSRKVKLFTNRC